MANMYSSTFVPPPALPRLTKEQQRGALAQAVHRDWWISNDRHQSTHAWQRSYNSAVLVCYLSGMSMKELLARTILEDNNKVGFDIETRCWSEWRTAYRRVFVLLSEKLTNKQLMHRFDTLREDCCRFCAALLIALRSDKIDNLTIAHRVYYVTGITKKALNKIIRDVLNGKVTIYGTQDKIEEMRRRFKDLELGDEPTRNWFIAQNNYNITKVMWATIFCHKHFEYTNAVVNKLPPNVTRQTPTRNDNKTTGKTTSKPTKKRNKTTDGDNNDKRKKAKSSDKEVAEDNEEHDSDKAIPNRDSNSKANTGWKMVSDDDFPSSWLELRRPDVLGKKTETAAANDLKNQPYPGNCSNATFIELAAVQALVHADLHARLHGFLPQEQFTQRIASCVTAGVPIVTHPNREATYRTEQDFVSSGQQVIDRWRQQFPDICLEETMGMVADMLLSKNKQRDANRNVIKINLGIKTRDYQTYSEIEEMSETFTLPKIHNSAEIVTDEQLRLRLAHIATFLQDLVFEEMCKEAFHDEQRTETFADFLSRQLMGKTGVLWEGFQLNLNFFPRQCRGRIPQHSFTFSFQGEEITVTAGGVAEHCDRNNDTRPGYNYLSSMAMVMNHEELNLTARVWFGAYTRVQAGHWIDRNGRSIEVLTKIVEYLQDYPSIDWDDIYWPTLSEMLPVVKVGSMKYVKNLSSECRWHFLATFVSSLEKIYTTFPLTMEKKVEFWRLAYTLNGSYNFKIVMEDWLKMETPPFMTNSTVTLAEMFVEQVLGNPKCGKGKPYGSPGGSARFGRCPVIFWDNLLGKDKKKKKNSTDKWNKSIDNLVKLIGVLRKFGKTRRFRSTDPSKIHKNVSLAVQGAKCTFGNKTYPAKEKAFNVSDFGPLRGGYVLPALIMSGFVGKEYIPAALCGEVNDGTTYAKLLEEKGFKSKQQKEALITFLAKELDKPRCDVENLLCKAYRKNRCFDFFWKDDYVYDFRGGKVVRKCIETGKENEVCLLS